jgi:hypothetical protein
VNVGWSPSAVTAHRRQQVCLRKRTNKRGRAALVAASQIFEPLVAGSISTILTNAFHTTGLKAGRTRARAKRVRGRLWPAVSSPISAGGRVPSRRWRGDVAGVDFRPWRVPSRRGFLGPIFEVVAAPGEQDHQRSLHIPTHALATSGTGGRFCRRLWETEGCAGSVGRVG